MWLSTKGSLGALARFVWVVEAIGGTLLDCACTNASDGRGVECDREWIGVRGAKGEYGTAFKADRLTEGISSKPRTWFDI